MADEFQRLLAEAITKHFEAESAYDAWRAVAGGDGYSDYRHSVFFDEALDKARAAHEREEGQESAGNSVTISAQDYFDLYRLADARADEYGTSLPDVPVPVGWEDNAPATPGSDREREEEECW